MTRAPQVAVVAVGDPESPQTWSGTTAGILAGLRARGVVAHPVSLALAPSAEKALLVGGAAATRNRYDAESAATTALARALIARARLRGVRLDGAIQIGSTFSLGSGVRYVTLEDMTLRQAQLVHPVFEKMSQAGIARWERRRAAIYAGACMCGAASHWTAGSLTGDYGVPSERAPVVGLGANHIAASAPRDWSAPRFLFVGIDWERKGGPLLLQAFARLRALVPSATLDLVGGHPEVHEPGVVAHGRRSPELAQDRRLMGELFARATCLVMPSLVEPFGIVHIEAAAAGMPSIGSSVGGARDVIAPPHGGLVVDPGDEQALFEAMRQLSDPDTARRMGAAAAERAALYTWGKVAERLLRALGLAAPDGGELAQFV